MENHRYKRWELVSLSSPELESYRNANNNALISFPNMAEIKSLIKLPQDIIDIIENGELPIILNDSGSIAVLCWENNKAESKEKFLRFMGEDWEQRCGEIRDQLSHNLCWAYVAGDLVSAKRRKYVPLSVWHMCAYYKPSLFGKDKSVKKGHVCFANSVENGLLHIQSHGGYKEFQKEFDCNDYEPRPSKIQIKRGEVTGVRNINTLEEALEELKKQPVGADLTVYAALLDHKGNDIYYGPKHASVFMGYHSVIMVGLKEIQGEIVVKCKLSNGLTIGDSGYIYVSLGISYIPVGVSQKNQYDVRGSVEIKAMNLLSEFVVPVMSEEKEGTEEDEEKEGTKEDEAKGEADYQKGDEDEEDKPQFKRPRTN